MIESHVVLGEALGKIRKPGELRKLAAGDRATAKLVAERCWATDEIREHFASASAVAAALTGLCQSAHLSEQERRIVPGRI